MCIYLGSNTVVYVTIGKLDWPDRFPDFFSGIEALIINESSSRVGLCLMRLCAEEFVKEKDAVVLTARKTQLKSLLIAQLPSIVACLGNTLSRISDMLHDPNIDPVKFQVDQLSSRVASCRNNCTGI